MVRMCLCGCDPTQAQIGQLQDTISQLQTRLAHYEGGGAALPPLAAAQAAPPAAACSASGSTVPSGGGVADAVLLRRVGQLQKENEGLKKRISSLMRAPAESLDAAGGVSTAMVLADPEDATATGELSSHRTSSGSHASDASESESAHAAGEEGGLSAAEDSAYAQEAMEMELEFLAKQGEISEELEGLNASLALKQALLAQQPEGGGDGAGGGSEEEMSALCDAMATLESRLKEVETERDTFHRQVSELRMHSDESGQPSKQAAKKLEALEAEISKLRRQRAQHEALLKARQASDARVKVLEGEIGSIKAQKVELTRRQREEADAHRAQRIARERELKQLRRQVEKAHAEKVKMEGGHAKQLAVIKRKNEELEKANAAHKKFKLGGDATPRPSLVGGGGGMGGGGMGGGGISARRPGGIMGATQASHARVEGKKAEDLQKAVSLISSKPREWLEAELRSVVEKKKDSEQLALHQEMRRQANQKLSALDVRDEQEQKRLTMAGEAADGENMSRETEKEALKAKIDHHAKKAQEISNRILRADDSSIDKKLDALREVKDAKGLLKVTLPQLVALRMSLEKKEQQAEQNKGSLKDASELANQLRLQMVRESKAAKEKLDASEQSLMSVHKELTELQGVLKQQAGVVAGVQKGAASKAAAPKMSQAERDAEDNAEKARLDARLARVSGQIDARQVSVVDAKLAKIKQQMAKKPIKEEESESEEESGSESGSEYDSGDDYMPTPKAKKGASAAQRIAGEMGNAFDGMESPQGNDEEVLASVAKSKPVRAAVKNRMSLLASSTKLPAPIEEKEEAKPKAELKTETDESALAQRKKPVAKQQRPAPAKPKDKAPPAAAGATRVVQVELLGEKAPLAAAASASEAGAPRPILSKLDSTNQAAEVAAAKGKAAGGTRKLLNPNANVEHLNSMDVDTAEVRLEL